MLGPKILYFGSQNIIFLTPKYYILGPNILYFGPKNIIFWTPKYYILDPKICKILYFGSQNLIFWALKYDIWALSRKGLVVRFANVWRKKFWFVPHVATGRRASEESSSGFQGASTGIPLGPFMTCRFPSMLHPLTPPPPTVPPPSILSLWNVSHYKMI